MTTIDTTINQEKQSFNQTEHAIKAWLERVGKAVLRTSYELIEYGPRAAVDMSNVFLYMTAIVALVVGALVLIENSALFAALLLVAVIVKLLDKIMTA